jgi:hypothetical protein
MLAVSGAAMLLADLETFWSAKAFWIKMSLVVLLLGNGLMMRHAEQMARTLPAKAWRQLQSTSIASLVLWFAILLAARFSPELTAGTRHAPRRPRRRPARA